MSRVDERQHLRDLLHDRSPRQLVEDGVANHLADVEAESRGRYSDRDAISQIIRGAIREAQRQSDRSFDDVAPFYVLAALREAGR